MARGGGSTVGEKTSLGKEAFYELDMDTTTAPCSGSWSAISGPVFRQGRVLVHVREVGMWTPYSGSAFVSAFEPEWVTRLPTSSKGGSSAGTCEHAAVSPVASMGVVRPSASPESRISTHHF